MGASKAKEESAQVKKYRRKLEKQMASESSLINESTLRKAKEAMQQWIARNNANRIDLRDKTIALFDGDRHPAPVESKYIQKLLEDLKAEAEKEQRSLKGRISAANSIEDVKKD